jgi:hypothetical protein
MCIVKVWKCKHFQTDTILNKIWKENVFCTIHIARGSVDAKLYFKFNSITYLPICIYIS